MKKIIYCRFLFLVLALLVLCACEKSEINKPVVKTTGSVTYPATMVVAMSGEVTDDGNGAVTERGILYCKENEDVYAQGIRLLGGSGIGEYICNTTLKANGSYSFCAYATNKAGTSYGEIKTFKIGNDASLSDFLGSYTMRVYSASGAGYETWGNSSSPVEIFQMSDGSICVYNLPFLHWRAYGVWDETNHNILLSDEYCCYADTFVSGGVTYLPIFTPCYYTKDMGSSFYKTVQDDNLSYICIAKNNDGTLAMVPPATQGLSGYSSNAFCWSIYNFHTGELDSYVDLACEVTLTKIANAIPPRKDIKTLKNEKQKR
ncbi:MAG: hypothetical protein KBT27_14715 [Prevotellaceae bacterium]|nr:hypothetical protein [Candidatus Faecinaster equi]